MEPLWVTRATRLPELSLARPSVQSVRILATSVRGVQLDLKHHQHHLTVFYMALLYIFPKNPLGEAKCHFPLED